LTFAAGLCDTAARMLMRATTMMSMSMPMRMRVGGVGAIDD
jgi:hypothetical protein